MESIILLILFAVVSSVIQAVIKNSKLQNQMEANAQSIKPKVQPNNEAVSKSYVSMEPEIYQEGASSYTFENLVKLDKIEEPVIAPNLSWSENITFDDLQRSIIMAEVLGKPKSLKSYKIILRSQAN